MIKMVKKMLPWLITAAVLISGAGVHVTAQTDVEEPTAETEGSVSNPNIQITAPSAVLMEASTGQIIYEKNGEERRSPASITKIMTLLLAMEALDAGDISLEDEIVTSEYASSMGGSQVYLAAGETQTLDTLLKCIAVASGNDASVAVAEHIAGTEEAFVALMNKRAGQLGLTDTHFMDCCGLSDSDEHYTTARDVAVMSRELIENHPKIFDYTMIWMEDITHVTRQGSSTFTLSSTNKLLKWYPYTTGLKTGSTSKAKYCISATAKQDELSMIAVVMGAEEPKKRFQDAQTLLAYGFSVSDIYIDENQELLPDQAVEGGVENLLKVEYAGEFRYLDVTGKRLDNIEKSIQMNTPLEAPFTQGQIVGRAVYTLDGKEIGSVDILSAEDMREAKYFDYLLKSFQHFLLGKIVVEYS